VDIMDTSRSSPRSPGPGVSGDVNADTDANSGVTALYQAHAVGFIRLAIVMLGERTAAEDVVQEAFFGLYRHWSGLADPANALAYVRSAVLNGCRNVLRVRGRAVRLGTAAVDEPVVGESADAATLVGEEHHEVLAAIRALPDRQREALVLRYYLDMSEKETASAMGISQGTVKSTTSRAVAALARMLKEDA
jgi:RNA polymerase sigma-70 factor (sigma-E family)